jgi:hypothetical protein
MKTRKRRIVIDQGFSTMYFYIISFYVFMKVVFDKTGYVQSKIPENMSPLSTLGCDSSSS